MLKSGEAYAIYGAWNGIMEACCIYAENVHIRSLEEAEQALYGSQEPPKKNLINIQKLEIFLNHASQESSISPNEIKKLIDKSKEINRQIESEKVMDEEEER